VSQDLEQSLDESRLDAGRLRDPHLKKLYYRFVWFSNPGTGYIAIGDLSRKYHIGSAVKISSVLPVSLSETPNAFKKITCFSSIKFSDLPA
jgi:hypothetical protein